jgi:ABC-type transporter Mla subunit MlaD
VANDSSSKTDALIQLRKLMQEASTASETARARLESAGNQLWELNQVLERLNQVSASLQPIANRLSDMTLDTAHRVWGAGKAGEPFLSLVSHLSDLSAHAGLAVGELEKYMRQATNALQAAVNDARQSSAELARILPALQAANRTPPPLPEENESAEKIVAFELKLTPAQDRAAGESRPPSILDAWPDSQGRPVLKN